MVPLSVLLFVLASAPALAERPALLDGEVPDGDGRTSDARDLRGVRTDGPAAIVNGVEGGPIFVKSLLWFDPVAQQGAVFCSATLITNRWLITAAHCVEAMETEYDGYEIWMSNQDRVYEQAWSAIQVESYKKHPDYISGGVRADLGLVYLSQPATGQGRVILNDEPVTDSWLGNTELLFVGYGITSDAAVDEGVKRKAWIPLVECLDTMGQTFVSCGNAGANLLYSEHPTRNVCSGDSGGAALELVDSTYWELVAVNSAVTPGCVGGANITVRVDRYLDWILENVPAAITEMPGGDPDPDTDTDTDSDVDTGSSGDSGQLDDTGVGPELRGSCACAASTGTSGARLGWLVMVVLVGLRRRGA